MDDTTVTLIVAVLTALPPTLAALAVLRQGRSIEKKADEIHTLTNSTNSNLQKALAVAEETVRGQQKLIDAISPPKLPEMKETP